MFKKTVEKISNSFNNKTKDSFENVSGLKKDVKSRFSNLMKDRKVNQIDLEKDFDLILEAWGLTESQIPSVCKDLTNRTFLYGILLVIASILFVQAFYFLTILLFICAFLGITTTLWRIFILKHRQYLSYLQYLFFFFGFKKLGKG